jgi:succinate dehydrogenase / fumarate reductase iron-sulfur subunit
VDMSSFARKLEGVHARVTNEVESSQQFVNCIECGLCISACPIAGTDNDYLGPAVLAAAQPNMERAEVRLQVAGPHGVWRCHSAFECTEVCPAGVEPGTAIMNLRKELVISTIRRKGS